uniref:SPRY domain-containing protein n=1 Tax=Compsopogon caeruleus TaxID=31354 RepID=A0A6T6BLU9_9RHOD|mmetsp:Transcript_17111/g.35610  ORF Transcript_17111/g.35610 Transcript_17111/m.35610 type:complete len:391 (+) Transcript_17111:179-1351(+)|eukprot:CAMPEP_0184688494 /NCGR_PEP_ID=MMETSP0312-20130426/30103_1 /TAXON_ID=31354 /ORGANISM="Compsopogon coeruleus, Strain SAG 36.94" /LENGTH=390 /DNA_ID=CAMNT_0027145731 /DNA_START=162 /DNA_END=1334 /DNA_ORIENTATION=-
MDLVVQGSSAVVEQMSSVPFLSMFERPEESALKRSSECKLPWIQGVRDSASHQPTKRRLRGRRELGYRIPRVGKVQDDLNTELRGVGLALREYDIPFVNFGSQQVDRGIMHGEVCSKPFVCVVLRNATSEDLGKAFDLPPHYITHRWFSEDDIVVSRKVGNEEKQRFLSRPCDLEEVAALLEQCIRGMQCGLWPALTHEDIVLTENNRLAMKTGPISYSKTLSSRTLPLENGLPVYVELIIMSAAADGGCSFGVTAFDGVQDKKIYGQDQESVAFFTSGQILLGGSLTKHRDRCQEGDILGCLVQRISTPDDLEDSGQYSVSFFVNGMPISDEDFLIFVPPGQVIHASVSLLGPGASVFFRCCPDELLLHEQLPPDTQTLCGESVWSAAL